MEEEITFGDCLRETRELLKLSRADLSRAIDKSVAYLGGLEIDQHVPSTECLKNIIDVYLSTSQEHDDEKYIRAKRLIELAKRQYLKRRQHILLRESRRYDVLYGTIVK